MYSEAKAVPLRTKPTSLKDVATPPSVPPAVVGAPRPGAGRLAHGGLQSLLNS